jgi:phage baseplate assembly protein W
MTSLLRAALDAVVASFGPELPAPKQPPEGFGVDLDCADDLDPMMSLVDGLRVVAQAVYRRLSTPRGMVIDAPDYGFDLRSLLHKGMTPAERAAIPGLVRAEVLKDQRIQRAEVQLTEVAPDALKLSIRCFTAEGPFRMTLHVNAAAILLTEVQPA